MKFRSLFITLVVMLGLFAPALAEQPSARARWTTATASETVDASSFGASPLASASSNSYAIQTALNAAHVKGGGVVYIGTPGIYLLNGAVKGDTSTDNYRLECVLVIYSDTTLLMADGVTLKMDTNTNCYFLRNNGSGAGTYGNYATYDKNIAVVGGTIDYNGANQNGATSRGDAKYWRQAGNWFDYVDGLTLSGVTQKNARKFLNHFTRCYRVRVENGFVPATLSDYLHFGAGCTDFVVIGCTATGEDNQLAIVTDEGLYYPDLSPPDPLFDCPRGAPATRGYAVGCNFPGNITDIIRLVNGVNADITDITIEGCVGDTSSTSAIKFIDDTAFVPSLSGGSTNRITLRDCSFRVAAGGFMINASCTGLNGLTIDNCKNPDNSQSLLQVNSRCYNIKNLQVINCTDEASYRGFVTFDTANLIAVIATTQVGGNATAYQIDEVVTQQTSAATGRFIKEVAGVVYLYRLTGTFTQGTLTLTGGTTGAVRVGNAATGNYSSFMAPLVENLVVANNSVKLGPDGRFFQSDGTITGTVSGNTVTGPSSHSSDAMLRFGANATGSLAVTGNTIKGIQYVNDASNTSLVALNWSGNTMTGYGSAASVFLYNRSSSAQVYIGGDGNHYTDWNNGSGGWYPVGVVTFASSPGYTRIRNPSLYIDGRAVQSAAMPSANEMRGDCFFNTYGSTAGGVAWGSMYGVVYYTGGTWNKWGW